MAYLQFGPWSTEGVWYYLSDIAVLLIARFVLTSRTPAALPDEKNSKLALLPASPTASASC